MLGSTFIAWLVLVLAAVSTRCASTRPLSWVEAGVPVAEAARELAGRFGCSQRQARRYADQAVASGRVGVPETATVFTVKLPVRLAAAVREHAQASGRTISAVVAQALEEFLERGRRNRPRR